MKTTDPLDVLARFTEGAPADPTENMSPEDAAKWQAMNEEHGDKFKTAAGRRKTYVVSVEGKDGPSLDAQRKIEALGNLVDRQTDDLGNKFVMDYTIEVATDRTAEFAADVVALQRAVRGERLDVTVYDEDRNPLPWVFFHQRTAAVSPKSRPGTKVVVKANPASRMLYNSLPPDGSVGTVTTVAGPRGQMSYMPGPGGGLLYVEFENGAFMGVSPLDLDPVAARPTGPTPDLKRAVDEFIAFCQKVYDDEMKRRGYTQDAKFSAEWGSRYIRIVKDNGSQRFAHGFIDQTNGDLLKTATWRAPALHARGNLYDKSTWAKATGPYGMAYMRAAGGDGDEEFWRKNYRTWKAQATQAARLVQSDPQKALAIARRLDAMMQEHGYPDDWARVERIKEDAQFAMQRQQRWAGEETMNDLDVLQKMAVGDIPADVERYVKEVRESNPDYDEARVWATAWSIYCAHKNPGSEHCHQDEYFGGRAASDPLDEMVRLASRPLHEIAREIRQDWKNVYFGAVPYLRALSEMDRIEDDYGMDSGVSVVLYFLANAQTWRGEVAKRIKKELSDMAKHSRRASEADPLAEMARLGAERHPYVTTDEDRKVIAAAKTFLNKVMALFPEAQKIDWAGDEGGNRDEFFTYSYTFGGQPETAIWAPTIRLPNHESLQITIFKHLIKNPGYDASFHSYFYNHPKAYQLTFSRYAEGRSGQGSSGTVIAWLNSMDDTVARAKTEAQAAGVNEKQIEDGLDKTRKEFMGEAQSLLERLGGVSLASAGLPMTYVSNSMSPYLSGHAMVQGIFKNPRPTPEEKALAAKVRKVLQIAAAKVSKGDFEVVFDRRPGYISEYIYNLGLVIRQKESAQRLASDPLDEMARLSTWEEGHRKDDDPREHEGEGSLIPGLEEKRAFFPTVHEQNPATGETTSGLPGDAEPLDEKSGKFEEGKPADPTENMTPEQKAEWEKQNAINRDKFKQADAVDEKIERFEEGKPADPTENMSPEDAKRWREEHAKHRDQFTKEAAEAKPGSKVKSDGVSLTVKKAVADGWIIGENPEGHLVLANLNETTGKWDSLEWFKGGEMDKAEAAAKKRAKTARDDIEGYYDFESGDFKRGGYLYFSLHGEDYNVEEDLRGGNGDDRQKEAEALFEGKDMGDVWSDLEMKALREMQKILDKPVHNEGHGSGGDLVCKVAVDSYKEFETAWKKLKFGTEDELTLDTPYFVARGFSLTFDPGLNHWEWDWEGRGRTRESIGDFLKEYKPGKKRTSALDENWGRTMLASRPPSGLYGFTREVQASCEGCIKRASKVAERIARRAYTRDERVASFLAVHAKRAQSLPARILMAAMGGIGPKFASMDKAAGYTHYWGMSRDFTDEEWVKIVQEAKKIVASATRDPHPQGKGTAGNYYDDQMAGGIVIAGPMGTGTPKFTNAVIALNGTDEGDLSHETFTLTKKKGRDFCKTARKPYDAVVVSILKAAKDIAPDAIDISSDGGDDAFKRVYAEVMAERRKVAGEPPSKNPADWQEVNDSKGHRWMWGGTSSSKCDAAFHITEVSTPKGPMYRLGVITYTGTAAVHRRFMDTLNMAVMEARIAFYSLDPDRQLSDNVWRKSASQQYGLYGYPARTASLGLNACTELRAEFGNLASDLHSRRADKHTHITGFFDQHSKQAQCLYSRMLRASYPDAGMKCASVDDGKTAAPTGDWLTWDR